MAYTPVTIDETQLAALEAEHEDILQLSGGERAPWTVVVRRPNRKESIGFKQHAQRDITTANEALLRRIVVAPKGDELEKMLERWPFLPDAVARTESFQEFIGLAIGAQLK